MAQQRSTLLTLWPPATHPAGIGSGIAPSTICPLTNTNPGLLSRTMANAAAVAMSGGAGQSFAFANAMVNAFTVANQMGCMNPFFNLFGNSMNMGGFQMTRAMATAFAAASTQRGWTFPTTFMPTTANAFATALATTTNGAGLFPAMGTNFFPITQGGNNFFPITQGGGNAFAAANAFASTNNGFPTTFGGSK